MANKWKYSTLTAEERLDKIRNGDKDVYNSEIERSYDVIKQREDAGLDVSEQNNWINKLNYNYGLSNGQKKKARILSGPSLKQIQAEEKIRKLLENYYAKVKEAEEQENHMKEWLINNGIDENSKMGKEYLERIRLDINDKISKYLSQYTSGVNNVLDDLR